MQLLQLLILFISLGLSLFLFASDELTTDPVEKVTEGKGCLLLLGF
jgi:hypothetical protein